MAFCDPTILSGTTEQEIVFRSDLVNIGLFRATPADPKFRESGPIHDNLIVFPRTSVSITQHGRDPVIASPNVVVFYNKGQTYHRRKVSDRGDVCEWFAFSAEVLDEAVSRHAGGLARKIDQPFSLTHGPSDPDSFLLQRAVVEHIVRHPSPDRLFVQEALIEVLGRTVAQAHRVASVTGRAATPAATARRRIARELQCFLAMGFRENLTLERIAATFRHSPFQLCRIFRRETGTTIHRYLNRIRLRTALEHVAQGHSDLARLALELGYSSHSHFTQSFRREFGIPPSRVRAIRSPRRLLQMRKNLTV